MDKIMPLDLLSSIKGAAASEAVTELFNVIKEAVADQHEIPEDEEVLKGISLDSLREDHIEACPEREKEIIRQNFPKEKNGYLVVPKVIDD